MGVQECNLTPLLEFMFNSCSMTPPCGQQAETGLRSEIRLSLFFASSLNCIIIIKCLVGTAYTAFLLKLVH